MESLGNILKTAIHDLGIEAPVQRYKAIALWPEIVGPGIAEVTEPKSMSGTKLIVRVTNDVWRHELLYHLPEIIVKINKRLGIQAVEEIILI
ncbi:DUF721 domain-containing protein [bacterium]|nr:DUF721 domain-containing protein [bacterium]